MRAQTPQAAAHRVPKWAGIAVLCGVLPINLPLFAKILGYSYLPSPGWVAKVEPVAIFAGALMAILMWWIASKSPVMVSMGRLRKTAFILLSPVFGFLVGKTTLVVAIPMAFALLLGEQVELTFKVSDSNGPPSRRCGAPLSLADMPILFDKLCFSSLEDRLAFQPGDSLIVRGPGTDMGVFVEAMRHGDP